MTLGTGYDFISKMINFWKNIKMLYSVVEKGFAKSFDISKYTIQNLCSIFKRYNKDQSRRGRIYLLVHPFR